METTGIYTRLTDAMTKEIARRTPTAIDIQAKGTETGRKALKETRAMYAAEIGEWEILLEAVLGEPSNL